MKVDSFWMNKQLLSIDIMPVQIFCIIWSCLSHVVLCLKKFRKFTFLEVIRFNTTFVFVKKIVCTSLVLICPFATQM